MRMRLTPDVRKMVISTLYGYLVVIHDLDLSSMSKDLAGQSLSNLSALLWIRIHKIRIRIRNTDFLQIFCHMVGPRSGIRILSGQKVPD
jgi:hypothetical protein